MEQLQARQRVQRAPAVVRRQEPASSETNVFSTHYLEEADAFAERIMVRAGKVVADGQAANGWPVWSKLCSNGLPDQPRDPAVQADLRAVRTCICWGATGGPRSDRRPAGLVSLADDRPGIGCGAQVPELVGVEHRADRLDLSVGDVESPGVDDLGVS